MITVIIPTWNARELLKSCLDALAGQTYSDTETLLADDGSTDGSADYVRREFPRVRVVALPVNRGFAAAVNAGLRVARGEYVALLNNDVQPDPRWLGEMLGALAKDEGLGFVGPKILNLRHRAMVEAAGGVLLRNGEARDRGRGAPDGPEFEAPRAVAWVTGAACLFRRAVFDRVGLLDESLGSMWEDVDICLRAQLCGFRGLYVPSAVVYHAVSATWGRDARRRLRLTSRNQNRVLLKTLPWRVLLGCMPRMVLHQEWMTLISLLRRDNWAYIGGKLDFLLGLRDVLRARKIVQKTRTVSDDYMASLIE